MTSPCVLTTVNAQGNTLRTEFKVDSFSYDLNEKMDSTQLHYFMEHHPIRLAEQTMQFTVTHRNKQTVNSFHGRIREHHLHSINAPQPLPMHMYFAPLSAPLHGLIEQITGGDQRFQVAYQRQYSMKLITLSYYRKSFMEGSSAPYLPTAQDAAVNDDWLRIDPYSQAANDGTWWWRRKYLG